MQPDRVDGCIADTATESTAFGRLLPGRARDRQRVRRHLPTQRNLISNNGGDTIGIIGDTDDGDAILRTPAPRTAPTPMICSSTSSRRRRRQRRRPARRRSTLRILRRPRGALRRPRSPGASVAAFAHTDGQSARWAGSREPLRFAGPLSHDAQDPPPGGQGLAHTPSTAAAHRSSRLSAPASQPRRTPAPPARRSRPAPAARPRTPRDFALDDPSADPDFQIFLCATNADLCPACGIKCVHLHNNSALQGPTSVTVLGLDEADAILSTPLTRSLAVNIHRSVHRPSQRPRRARSARRARR